MSYIAATLPSSEAYMKNDYGYSLEGFNQVKHITWLNLVTVLLVYSR